MSIASFIVVYVILWWLVFIMALPWGVRRAGDNDEGHDPGAPANPRLLLKAAVTTVIAGILTVVAWWVISAEILEIR